MNKNRIILTLMICLLSLTAGAQEAEEVGHMHGPDGRHVAVASTFGEQTAGQKSILSHHDLMITYANESNADGVGKPIEGCDVHSVIHKKGDPKAVIHREHNAYESENGVYGSHMVYREPGEYVIVETITLPDKEKITIEFPVYVPDTAPTPAKKEEAFPTWVLLGGVVGFLALLVTAFLLGRRSGKQAVSIGLLFTLLLSTPPFVQAQEEEAESHLHGPDGRHIAVASTFGGEAGRPPLKAYPNADRSEFAVQTVGKYRFRLSIENEEMDPPDPEVVPVSTALAKTIGLEIVPVTVAGGGNTLSTTGKVEPNPNRFVTVSTPVGGRIAQVGLTRGDTVGAGHLVAVIDSPEIAAAQGELRTAIASKTGAQAGQRRADALVAEAMAGWERAIAEASVAQTKWENARKSLLRQQKLAEEGAFAAPSVEVARRELASAEGEVVSARTALSTLEAQEKRLRTGLAEGLVARKDVEAAQSATEQGKTRLATAERQTEIARTALAREERIQSAGLRNAREIQQAESDVSTAQAAYRAAQAVADSEEKRLRAARNVATEARATTAQAEAGVTSARNRVRLLGGTEGGGSRITIRTPIGGEVETRPVNVGEVVPAGQELASILDAEVVWVESDVYEKDLSRVRIGQEVTILAEAVPGREFRGRISYIGGEVNAETRAVRVRTVVNNPGEMLKPNMFARILIDTGEDRGKTLLVPVEAVQEEGGKQFVFVQEGEESYRRKEVQVGATFGDKILIRSGVKSGERVVTTGAYQLLALVKAK
jgi:cobalt-zinc-cadmium efflux system membrane fusion protein